MTRCWSRCRCIVNHLKDAIEGSGNPSNAILATKKIEVVHHHCPINLPNKPLMSCSKVGIVTLNFLWFLEVWITTDSRFTKRGPETIPCWGKRWISQRDPWQLHTLQGWHILQLHGDFCKPSNPQGHNSEALKRCREWSSDYIYIYIIKPSMLIWINNCLVWKLLHVRVFLRCYPLLYSNGIFQRKLNSQSNMPNLIPVMYEAVMSVKKHAT